MRCDRCGARTSLHDSHTCSGAPMPVLSREEVAACKLLAHALFCRSCIMRVNDQNRVIAHPDYWALCGIGQELRTAAEP